MEDIAIRLQNVSKTYRLMEQSNSLHGRIFGLIQPNHRRIEAVKNINLEIKRGELFSIIGHNGSGKSSLLSVIAGAYPPDKGGIVDVRGRMIKLSLGMGFDPKLSGIQNIMINASILGLTIKETRAKLDEIIAFAELEKFKDTKVKYYSSGMKSRLMFAIAIHAKADILLMDEFFGGVGDEGFRKKADQVFKKHFIEGKTIIHVSHSMSDVLEYSDRAMLLQRGECIALGDPKMVIETYRSLNDKSL